LKLLLLIVRVVVVNQVGVTVWWLDNG
jgi:hypothetical protein